MKKYIFSILFIAAVIPAAVSQENDPSWGIKFTGFVKNDIFFDTRQSTASNGLREGHFYLFPDNAVFDMAGKDINANPSLHFLSIQTRIRGDISGPDAFGARTSGAIEAEFFGTSEADINGFRLRHAYVRLDWEKTSLMTGQFWHPMFTSESFPGTVSFNTGAPFIPFSRNPQARLSRTLGKASLSLTAYGQRDFTSPGPDGNSSKYLRNSCIPGLNLQAKIPAGDMLTAWLGFDYKVLRPELRTELNFETSEKAGSYSAFANFKIRTEPVNVSMMAVYAQNGSDLMMIGGYAISSITLPELYKTYTTLNTGSVWVDAATNGKKTSFGLFAGFSSNFGASETIEGSVYGRGTNIDHLFRISPRITFTAGKLSFAGEIENTTAAYGTMQNDGKVINTDNVSNLRILLSTIYRF